MCSSHSLYETYACLRRAVVFLACLRSSNAARNFGNPREQRPRPLRLTLARMPVQEMMEGEKTLIGNGNIRDVYLVEWGGRKLVVKYLREDFEQRASRSRVENIHRWEAVAIDAVRALPARRRQQ